MTNAMDSGTAVILLPAIPAAPVVGTIPAFPRDPGSHFPVLIVAVGLSVAFCAATWIFSKPRAWLGFPLSVHASLAVFAGRMAWQYLPLCLARLPTDPLQVVSEFPRRFRYLVHWLRERYGLLPALAPIAAPAVCRTTAIDAAVELVHLRKGRAFDDEQPRWAV